tara:strand:+ start:13922 stop:14242 length:321 start_codon:yes stop_codon:yes gene_type:complete
MLLFCVVFLGWVVDRLLDKKFGRYFVSRKLRYFSCILSSGYLFNKVQRPLPANHPSMLFPHFADAFLVELSVVDQCAGVEFADQDGAGECELVADQFSKEPAMLLE